jgi:hypothetical protein
MSACACYAYEKKKKTFYGQQLLQNQAQLLIQWRGSQLVIQMRDSG